MTLQGRPFLQMNGAGNAFLILPSADGLAPSAEETRALAAAGLRFDQLITLGPSRNADLGMRIWNVDGGTAGACGNANRCVAWLVMRAAGRECARIETPAGPVESWLAGADRVTVDMGAPRLDWREIPLARPADTLALDTDLGTGLAPPGCVSMGNPHVVFFVADLAATEVEELGARLQDHPLFPAGVNVGFAQVLEPQRLRLRVFERGAGLTPACGTGACAAVVAGARRGLLSRRAEALMDGGTLEIDWREEDGHVLLTGAIAVECAGRICIPPAAV